MSQPIQVPAPNEVFDVSMSDGAQFQIRRHGNPDGVRLYISHGNGFAVNAYFPFWERLAAKFDLIIFDMRNHGMNAHSGFDRHNYFQMAKDLSSVVDGVEEKLGTGKRVGVFHSMSARAAMKNACEMSGKWDALALYDPPNVPPKGHQNYERMRVFELRLTDFAANREESFTSPDLLAAYYAESRAHQNWVEGAHQLMAENILTRNENSGEWNLICPREYEASIYLAALTLDLWPDADQFDSPVKLICADPEVKKGSPTGPTNKALALEGGYNYEAIEGTGHLLQIEEPEACANALLSFLSECGLA